MNEIDYDLNNFNYTFQFEVETGSHQWNLSFGQKVGHQSSFDNLVLSEKISGDFTQSYTLSQNNDYLVIGDPGENTVDVYENLFFTENGQTGFQKVNQLTGHGVSQVSGFGRSIELIDNRLFIGAPSSNDNKGALFGFYEPIGNTNGATGASRWNQNLSITGAENNGSFGSCIAAIENQAEYITAVSAVTENNSGAVYLYDETLLNLIKKIEPQGSHIESFGKSLYFASVDSIKYLFIGYDQSGIGKVDAYKETQQNLKDFIKYRTIESNQSLSGNLFGHQIDGFADYFLISSPNESNSGAAFYYIYNYESGFFEHKQTIANNSLASGDSFGKNISFYDNDGVITSNLNSGTAHIFHRENETWEQVASITGAQNSIENSFGGNTSGSFNTSFYDKIISIGSVGEYDTYVYTTGLENHSEVINFSFSGVNGKLYDNDGNFIFGYSPEENYLISGNVFRDHSNIFINGVLANSHISRNTGITNAWETSGEQGLAEYLLTIYDITEDTSAL